MGKRMNLTYATGMVLQAIDVGFSYGFDVMDASGLPDGTVYPALRRLEAAGLLSARWEDDAVAEKEKRPPRRYYELTPAGHEKLVEARARFRGLEMMIQPARGPS